MELVIWTCGAARHPRLGDGCLGTAEQGRWKLRRVGGMLEAWLCAPTALAGLCPVCLPVLGQVLLLLRQ